MIVLIDGRSGSGKTTLARSLGEKLGMLVLHMDDIYPGWNGLDAGVDIVCRYLLDSENPRYPRWDWENSRQGEWIKLPESAHGNFILEGVGCASDPIVKTLEAQVSKKYFTIFLDAPAELRKTRALQRDPGYAPYWDMWAAQEENLEYTLL
ncbi:MAG: hypothetical protein Q3972_01840 [Corynebacterium sp.]|nr:hypothetical protein [Corynebacterium sp.]